MNRLITLVGTAVVAGAVYASPAEAQLRSAAVTGEDRVPRMATASASGLIEGAVVDEHGQPLAGAMVSALGATTALAVTDRAGSFRLASLPAGGYLVRAHLAGFAPSRRELVHVGSGRPARFSATLRRTDGPADPSVLAAGIGPIGEGLEAGGEGERSDSTEATWRLRHIRRSILKETTERVMLADEPEKNAFSVVTGALNSSAQFLADLPITAEVNFLTSGSFGAADAEYAGSASMRRTAYVSIGGTAFSGDWSGQVMTQGALGSWFVAGSYRKRAPSNHLFDVGVSYSTQRFTSPARWPMSPDSDGSRSAGAIHGVDRWTFSRGVTLTYGGRYARYDYLAGGLFSPHVNLVLEPARGLRVVGTASRRLLAPGAEEFVAPMDSGVWLPPEHSFVGASAIQPESTNHFEFGLERDVWRELVVAVRAFVQQTRNQQAALFDSRLHPESTGHYEVADAGNVDAKGWSVGVSGSPWSGARGSVVYSMTSASWFQPAAGQGLLLVGIVPRHGSERLHDLTTSLEAEIDATETTVLVAYRLNSGFARPYGDSAEAGIDGRFDVQVVQRLPFLDFTSARWQALVAVRNTFRDPTADASIYDELLVIRPPKRVVGGFLVRF